MLNRSLTFRVVGHERRGRGWQVMKMIRKFHFWRNSRFTNITRIVTGCATWFALRRCASRSIGRGRITGNTSQSIFLDAGIDHLKMKTSTLAARKLTKHFPRSFDLAFRQSATFGNHFFRDIRGGTFFDVIFIVSQWGVQITDIGVKMRVLRTFGNPFSGWAKKGRMNGQPETHFAGNLKLLILADNLVLKSIWENETNLT